MITDNNKLTSKTTPLIAWVVVNYFNDTDTLSFITKEYEPQQDDDIIIYVVNNGSKNINRLKEALQQFKKVSVISDGNNLGYMGAFCFAMKNFYESYECYPRKAILSNTDLILPQQDFVKSLLKLKLEKPIACIGPQIIHAVTNKNQNPLYSVRPSKLKLKFLSIIFSSYPLYLVYQYMFYVKNIFFGSGESNEAKNVYAIHGSFMILSQHFLDKFFTELQKAPFLLGEELFIAELCKTEKWQMAIDYNLKVIHNEHAVTGKYKSRKIVKHLRNSIKIIVAKFYQ